VEIDSAVVERISVAQQRSGYEPWAEQTLNLSN